MDKFVTRLWEFLPFILITNGEPRSVIVNWARVIEGVIIACIAGMAAGYISVAEIKVEIRTILDKTNKQDVLIDTIRNKQVEIDELLHQHIGQTDKYFQEQLDNKRLQQRR